MTDVGGKPSFTSTRVFDTQQIMSTSSRRLKFTKVVCIVEELPDVEDELS